MSVIALDLGGTKLSVALFSDQGKIVIKTKHELGKRAGHKVGELVIQQINELLNKAEELKEKVSAIGICVPGIANAKTGKVWAPNIPGWDNYPLHDEVKNSISKKKLKIKIDSDRACYILGEVWKGNARGCSDAIFLAVGTGIGAGILVNGEVLRGAHNIAGAIGWMALDRPFKEKYISCGNFEYNASGEGIARVAKEFISSKQFPDSVLNKKIIATISAKDVFDAYEAGDDTGKKIIANAVEFWGMAVANLVSLFNPEKIIFGGGVFGPAQKFIPDILKEALKWAQPISIKQVKLESSALGADAGLYGAAWMAMKD